LFYGAYCVGAAFYCLGFAETFQSKAGFQSDAQIFPWNPNGSWVTLVIASLANLSCAAVTLLGLRVSVRVSACILATIYLCITISCICLVASTTDAKDGQTSFSLETFGNNTEPMLTGGKTYASVFAIFFPGFTGVLAGANLSGQLRDPSESIAKGSLLALLSAYCVYVLIAFILASTVQRSVSTSSIDASPSFCCRRSAVRIARCLLRAAAD
jgi:amino acid transporter